jgi:hypothetical protein
LYRSEAPSNDLTDYDLIDSGLESSMPFFEDSGVDGLRTHTRDWYYKIKVKNTSTDEEEIQPAQSYAYVNDEAPDRRWLKIVKLKKLALKKDKAGVDFILLKKRT